MIDYHRTASCPWCGKDSYASEAEAHFGTAKCTWCKCEFKTKSGDSMGDYTIVKEGTGTKKE